MADPKITSARMTATEVRRRQAEADAREASLAAALFLDALLGLQIVIAAVSAADAAVRAAPIRDPWLDRMKETDSGK